MLDRRQSKSVVDIIATFYMSRCHDATIRCGSVGWDSQVAHAIDMRSYDRYVRTYNYHLLFR